MRHKTGGASHSYSAERLDNTPLCCYCLQHGSRIDAARTAPGFRGSLCRDGRLASPLPAPGLQPPLQAPAGPGGQWRLRLAL